MKLLENKKSEFQKTSNCHITYKRTLTEVPPLLENHVLKLFNDLEYFQIFDNDEKVDHLTGKYRGVPIVTVI